MPSINNRIYEHCNRKMPAPNGRFYEMAAVPPQTILCGIERLSPAGTLVEAATCRQATATLSAMSGDNTAGQIHNGWTNRI